MRLAITVLALAACTERNLAVGESSIFDASAVVDMAAVDLRHPSGDLAHVCPTRECTVDAGSVCPSAAGQLEVAPGAVQLKFCRCLHGCGPGIDGSIEIVVSNFSDQSHALHLQSVDYVSNSKPGFDDTSATLMRFYTCAGEAEPWDEHVLAGAIDRLRIAQHFDVPLPDPGDYSILLSIAVDGQPVVFDLNDYVIDDDPTCN